MADANKTAFFEQYAPLAMEQQKRYGIPASVTLVQAWWERGAANRLNNYFGIKADSSWLKAGKPYGEFKDDEKGLSKFRQYDSVQASFEDHSRFLLNNKRYSSAWQCASDDYEGWLKGLQKGGYSTNPSYVANLEADIKAYGLDRYDKMAIQEARNQGLQVGYARSGEVVQWSNESVQRSTEGRSSGYFFPVGEKEDLVVTSGYGNRSAPTKGASCHHNGIDIRANYENVYSTESGRVINVGSNSKAGNYVIVEYERSDQKNYRVSYCHLDDKGIFVKEGQDVTAGTVIARSGSSGVSTAPHLHLTVRQSDGNGKYEEVNPLDYLAEISVRGGLTATVLDKTSGKDLLASRRNSVDVTPTPSEVLLAEQNRGFTEQQKQNLALSSVTTEDNTEKNNILSYLMNQNNVNDGKDMLTEMISTLFKSALFIGMMLDNLGNQNNEVAEQPVPLNYQNEEQRSATLLQRRRDSINPTEANDLARMTFDAEYPEQQQEVGLRRA